MVQTGGSGHCNKNIINCACGSQVYNTTINIGAWDMDTDATKVVAHGVTLSKILNVSLVINNDTETEKFLAMGYDGGTVCLNVGVIDTNNITLERKAGGTFDNANFSNTGISRGKIILLLGV